MDIVSRVDVSTATIVMNGNLLVIRCGCDIAYLELSCSVGRDKINGKNEGFKTLETRPLK